MYRAMCRWVDIEEDDTMTELTLTEKIPIAGKPSTSHMSEGIFGFLRQTHVYDSSFVFFVV